MGFITGLILGTAIGTIFSVPIYKLMKWLVAKFTKKTEELK